MIKLLDLFKQVLVEDKQMLKEVGETTYDISDPKIVSSNPTKNVVKYFFTNKAESDYEVVFDSEFLSASPDHKWETTVTFDIVRGDDEEELYAFEKPDEEHSETGEKDAIAVLFTVAKAIKEFIKEFKPEFLTYSGSLSGKELSYFSDPEKKEKFKQDMRTVRDRIYDKMLSSMIKDFPDYDYKRTGTNMDIFYRGELPVPGHHKIFDYPTK